LPEIALPIALGQPRDLVRNVEDRRLEWGDRRGSNPRPSLEPQSADISFWELLSIAESAYLNRFICLRLRIVSACCALGDVNCGVKWYRQLLS
jgi:hypothetical protein